MKSKIDRYIAGVMEYLVVEEELKERIEADLRAHITELSRGENVEEVMERLGSPEEVAREFMDSIYEDKSQIIDNLVKERMRVEKMERSLAYEYKSRITLFGLPLVHINFRWGRGIRVARGIIAIGDIAVGIISCGGIALGGISLGGVSLGLLALGGASLGAAAFGGLALGLAAMGGLAIGLIAQGGLAMGKVAIGGKAIGEFAMEQGANWDSAYELIKNAFPNLEDWIIRTLVWPWKYLGQ